MLRLEERRIRACFLSQQNQIHHRLHRAPRGGCRQRSPAVGKFIARLEKRFPGLVRGIVTGAGSVAASARAIADYAKRIPAPPGGDTIDHAVEMVLVMVRQSVRVLTLPGVAVDRAVEAITLVWRRAGSAWGDEAVEGVALVRKRCFPQAVAANGGCGRKPDGLLLKRSRIGSRPESAMRSCLPTTEHAFLQPNRTHEKSNWSPVTPTFRETDPLNDRVEGIFDWGRCGRLFRVCGFR